MSAGLAFGVVAAVGALLLAHKENPAAIDCTAPVDPKLVVVDCTIRQQTALLEHSVEAKGSIRKVRSVVRRLLPEYGEGVFVITSDMQADCQHRTFASGNFSIRQGNRVVAKLPGWTGWQPISRRSQGEALFDKLCSVSP